MADFYKNCDKICDDAWMHKSANGVQYYTVEDLAEEPITLDFFKAHCRIDFQNDDTLCETYIKAARRELEMWSQLSFGVKTMGLLALELPKNYKLMFGKVDTILTANFTNFGDILKEGGSDINIEFTTKDWIDDAIRIAIARYAAGLYIFRENIVDAKYQAKIGMDEAKAMLQPYRNLILF